MENPNGGWGVGEGGFTIMEIRGHGGKMHNFWKFRRQGGLNMEAVLGMVWISFWNRPIKIHVFVDKTNVILLFTSLLSRNSPILIS